MFLAFIAQAIHVAGKGMPFEDKIENKTGM